MDIVYLFGAGASIHAVPTVKRLPDALHTMSAKLKSYQLELEGGKEYTFLNNTFTASAIASNLAEKLQWLSDESRHHASIDTYAKKLFLKQDEDKLLELKAAFMAFLSLTQLENPTDPRYDSFFASLLNRNLHQFPNNVQILSWNYDNQFEKGYYEFSDGHKLQGIHHKFKRSEPESYAGFGIYKLNGSNHLLNRHFEDSLAMFDPGSKFCDSEICRVCVKYFDIIYNRATTKAGLSFSWEGDDQVRNAKKAVKEADILIVIGYSFPFFNHQIDLEIIQEMHKLKKIYIQNPEAIKIKQRLNSVINVAKIEIVPINDDLEQFLLPLEL